MRRTDRRRAGAAPRPDAPNPGAVVRVPHDSVNEMVLIAAVIVDADVRRRYLQTTTPEMFHGTGHATLWATLQAMDRQGLHYDPATLRQMGGVEVDVDYVENLIAQRPAAPPNLKHHVEMLWWDAARVAAAQGPVTRFLELLKDTKTDPLLLRSAATAIADTLTTGTNRSLRNPQQLVDEQMGVIRHRRSGVATYGFGIEGLDFFEDGEPRLIPGTAPKTVTCVTGVSGSGKTTAVTRAVLGMYRAGRRVAYGAYEQGSGMSLELLATMALGFCRTDMMTGKFDDNDEHALRVEMESIAQHVVFDEIPVETFTNKRGNVNARAIERIAQSIVDSRCDVYVADLFRRTMGETDPDDEEYALYAMQALAKRLHVHLVLVQQQNAKQVEATKTKLPRRETIKGSGAWVEVPDQIIAWHRPALWKNVPDDLIYSLVLKQRFGQWPLMVEHQWDPQYGSIEGGKSVEVQRHGDADEAETNDGFWSPRTKP